MQSTASLDKRRDDRQITLPPSAPAPHEISAPALKDPVWVYDTWAAYTDGFYKEYFQLPDETRLTEALAMKQLNELVRLKHLGASFDYYMMNAFWFDPDGAYRTWRLPDWPKGPDRWIEACYAAGVRPGLWFGTNSLWKINLAPQWRDSLASKKQSAVPDVLSLRSMSLHEGGFLSDFMEVLHHWYDRGIRMFEFDGANIDSATAASVDAVPLQEIRRRNRTALTSALKEFRRTHPEAMLVAFNDFGGDLRSTATPFPFKRPIDLRWMEVFDTIYTGDTRVSDVPLYSFWRSVDLFNDHMTRRYEQSGIPLERCDPFFTLSSTWFGYHRQKQAWKSMLLLSLARGSWKKTVYGDLSLLNDEDAAWFARVQNLYAPLVAMGRTKSFGGVPGRSEPYGFGSYGAEGAIYTVVNPSQQPAEVTLPPLSKMQQHHSGGRIVFRDEGFKPTLQGTTLTLGPEQMAVVGFGRYCDPTFDLGIEHDVIIPHQIEPLEAVFVTRAENEIEARFNAPAGGVRILMSQHETEHGLAHRSAPLTLVASQNGRALALQQPHQNTALATGISWAVGEIAQHALVPGKEVIVRCKSTATQRVTLQGTIYQVVYDPR